MDNPKGLLLIADGLVYPLFSYLLERGELPNIQKYIYDRAIVKPETTITINPSSTAEGMQSLHTGMFPNDPGAAYVLPSGYVYDMLRADNLQKGYMGGYESIFSMLEKEGKRTATILDAWNDGSRFQHHKTLYIENLLRHAHGYHGVHAAAVNRYISLLKDVDPDLTSIWFPFTDRWGHKIQDDDDLAEKYKKLDSLIGKIGKELERTGKLEDTIIIFTSDHSMAKVDHHVNPYDIVREAGLRPLDDGEPNPNAKVLAYAYSIGQVYPDSLDGIEEVIEKILEQEGPEFVLQKFGNDVVVHSKDGKAHLSRAGNKYWADKFHGPMPDWAKSGISRDAHDWLALTVDDQYPAIVPVLAESLKHPDAPPIRIITNSNYALGIVKNGKLSGHYINLKHSRSHGSPDRRHSEVPLVIAASPSYGKSDAKTAFNFDWLNTFLDLADYEKKEHLDSRSLVNS